MHFPKFLRLILLQWAENIKINSTTTIRKMYFHPVNIEVASLLAKMYKFSYEIVSPTDNEYGRQLPNGNWTGMIDMLLRQEGDISISILTITIERMAFIDFGFPVQRAPFTFVTTKPEYSPDIMAYLNPFTADLWISLVAFLILLPTIFLAFFKGRCTYGKLLLATFRSLLTQPLGITPLNAKEYFLIFFYIAGTIFFIHSYTCVLLSFITFPKFTGVRTIPELAAAVAAGKYQVVSYPGVFYGASLSKSEDPNFRIIGRNVLQNEGSFDIFEVLRSSKGNSKKAFISGIEALKPFKEKYFISQDEFFPLNMAFSMRKDFCCSEQVTRFVTYIHSSGLYQNMLERYAFRESLKHVFDNDEGNRSVRQFSLEDMAGAFFVLCTGYALSVAVLIFEMIFHRF